ncbi:hypothetical protein HanIR_Chr14g0698631 [Helianthus annuus]|nr:hypothetical protein HanIR_Chr14g0698631 [Helianthus annuus]
MRYGTQINRKGQGDMEEERKGNFVQKVKVTSNLIIVEKLMKQVNLVI